MITALVIIAIILVSGGFRTYFKKKYDVTNHLEEVKRATRHNKEVRLKTHV